jgi:hypothetical protein
MLPKTHCLYPKKKLFKITQFLVSKTVQRTKWSLKHRAKGIRVKLGTPWGKITRLNLMGLQG